VRYHWWILPYKEVHEQKMWIMHQASYLRSFTTLLLFLVTESSQCFVISVGLGFFFLNKALQKNMVA